MTRNKTQRVSAETKARIVAECKRMQRLGRGPKTTARFIADCHQDLTLKTLARVFKALRLPCHF